MRRLVAACTLWCFIFVYVVPLGGGSFEDAVTAGRSLGQSLGSSVSPRSVNPGEVVPGYDPSRASGYQQFYTNPGGMADAELSPVAEEVRSFMRESDQRRPRYNLEYDPVFGNRCLGYDSEGRCTAWSLSKDLLTQSYPDCERVLIPEYETATFEKCTGTRDVRHTPECTIRQYVDVQVSEVTGPCSSADLEVLPDQIYAVCKDRVEVYRLFMGTLELFCGHGKYADDVLCQEGRCSFCYYTACPTGYTVTDPSQIPAGSVYLGDGVDEVWLSGGPGRRVAHGSWYRYYLVRHPSAVERVFLRKDMTCNREDFRNWLESCPVVRYTSCDSSGQNCVDVFLDGEETGQLPPERCSDYPAVIGTYGQQCSLNCSSAYSVCIDDCRLFRNCQACSGCLTCGGGCTACTSCENCEDREGGLNCTMCTDCSGCKQGQQSCSETGGCGLCSFCTVEYESGCLEDCERSFCQESCSVGQVKQYTVCTLPDSSQGVKVNGTVVTPEVVVSVETFRENNLDVTFKTVAGGPGVQTAVNDWYARVVFGCYEDVSDCQNLIDRGCTFYSSRCVDQDCTQYEYTYRCGEDRVKRYTVAYNCSGQIRCIGTDCADASYDPSGDFGYAVTFAEILNMARTDTLNFEIFPGKVKRCQSAPTNCCKPSTGGISLGDYVALARSMYTLYGVVSQGFSAVASQYASNITTAANLMAAKLGLAQTTTSTIGAYSVVSTTTTIQSSFGTTVVTTTFEPYVAATEAVASTPVGAVSTIGTVLVAVQMIMVAYTIASIVYNYLFGCKKEDYETSALLGFRVCHYIGTHTERKFGLVRQSWRYYCCFNSVLARIIHEQGRPQIGKEWGSPRQPHCEGFTPEELASIDFSKIDLSEYLQYVTLKKELTQEDIERISERIQSRFR